jgi:hypothetical protein
MEIPMQGAARILLGTAPKGAGFLIGTRWVATCAHVVNTVLGRDRRAQEPPAPGAEVKLDFPNHPRLDGEPEDHPRRTAQVAVWHPPPRLDTTRGPMDDIAVLVLTEPMPAAAIPPFAHNDWPELRSPLYVFGTPSGTQEGLWAGASLSLPRGTLRQVDLNPGGPVLQLGFSGGPVCAVKDGSVLGMLAQINEGERAAWAIPVEALRNARAELQLTEVRIAVRDGRLYVAPTGPDQGTDYAELLAAAEAARPGALLGALFGDHPPEPDPSLPGADTPPRLRIRTADPAAADLPWHLLPDANGRSLGEQGWIIEVTGTEPRPALTLEIDNPLILAPASNELLPGVNLHVERVAASMAPLLSHDHAKVSWVVDPLGLDDALSRKQPPDLIYCFARLTKGHELLLGRSKTSAALLPLDDLLERLTAPPVGGAVPPIWLHLVPGDPDELNRKPILQRLARCPLGVLQITKSRLGDGLKRTLAALDALATCRRPEDAAPCPPEPAAVLSRLGDPGIRYILGNDGLRLSPTPADEEWNRASIRASLIQLLLGRAEEKAVLADRVQAAENKLVLYQVCGNRLACVHDFSEQARWHLEERDPELTVRQLRIPGQMGRVRDPRTLEDQLAEALGYDEDRETIADVLRRIARREPGAGQTLVVSLAWHLEPAPDLDADAAINWLSAWKRALLGLFGEDQIPDRHRVLAGICLQWRDDGPTRAKTDASRLQQDAIDLLDPRLPAHCALARITKPLDRLYRGDLTTFFRQQKQRGRECLRGLEPDDLADWVHAATSGTFEHSVDLIHQACKTRFADLRAGRPAAANTGSSLS